MYPHRIGKASSLSTLLQGAKFFVRSLAVGQVVKNMPVSHTTPNSLPCYQEPSLDPILGQMNRDHFNIILLCAPKSSTSFFVLSRIANKTVPACLVSHRPAPHEPEMGALRHMSPLHSGSDWNGVLRRETATSETDPTMPSHRAKCCSLCLGWIPASSTRGYLRGSAPYPEVRYTANH
jgi:hypothetical protein